MSNLISGRLAQAALALLVLAGLGACTSPIQPDSTPPRVSIGHAVHQEARMEAVAVETYPQGLDGPVQVITMIRELDEEGEPYMAVDPNGVPMSRWELKYASEGEKAGFMVVDNVTGKVFPAAVNVLGAITVADIQKCEGDGCGSGGVLNVVQPRASAASFAQTEATSSNRIAAEGTGSAIRHGKFH